MKAYTVVSGNWCHFMVREVFPPIGTEALYVDNAGSAGITPSVKPARWEAHMC